MNGYTSGKASHDPEPWVSGHEHHTRYATNGVPPRPSNDEDGWQCSLCVRRYQPRPEFDNHNPILSQLREEAALVGHPLNEYEISHDLSTLRNQDWAAIWAIDGATQAHRDHAVRVLSKLAAIR